MPADPLRSAGLDRRKTKTRTNLRGSVWDNMAQGEYNSTEQTMMTGVEPTLQPRGAPIPFVHVTGLKSFQGPRFM